jgi:hypothetical protein
MRVFLVDDIQNGFGLMVIFSDNDSMSNANLNKFAGFMGKWFRSVTYMNETARFMPVAEWTNALIINRLPS